MKHFSAAAGWRERNLRFKLSFIVGVIWTVYTLFFLLDLFLIFFDFTIYSLTHRAISTCLLTVLVFLIQPVHPKLAKERLQWYDIIPILATIAGCAYIAVMANTLVAEGRLMAKPFEMILGAFTFAAVIEATRRTTGSVIAVLIIFSFFYAIYSNHFPGLLKSTGFSYSMGIGWMYLSGEGFWGMIVGIVSTIVAGFIIFGGFLKAVGADRFFNDLALATAGFMRGGTAKAAVIASTLFGTISGSIAANIATTGQITIPMMKKGGFDKDYAGAVEATASTGGMFMPPLMGATAFLMAEFLQITYWEVCVAAILPALAYYITLFAQIDMESAKIGLKGIPRKELPSFSKTMKGGWQYLLPLILLIVFLGVFRYSAQTSIMYTLGALVVVSFFNAKSRLTPKKLFTALEDSARGMTSVIPLCTAIGILVGAVEMTGLGTQLTSKILEVSGGNLFILLLLAAVAAFVLGMGMTAVSVYILTVVLLAPALVKSGIEPIAAHMFLFYFGCLSFITPPVCVGAYIAAGISGGDAWKTGIKAVCLGFAAFLVPFAFVFNPGILMIGPATNILLAFVCVTLGTVIIGSAFERFLLIRLMGWERIVLGFCGILVFIPDILTRSFGILVLALFLISHIKKAKKQANFGNSSMPYPR